MFWCFMLLSLLTCCLLTGLRSTRSVGLARRQWYLLISDLICDPSASCHVVSPHMTYLVLWWARWSCLLHAVYTWNWTYMAYTLSNDSNFDMPSQTDIAFWKWCGERDLRSFHDFFTLEYSIKRRACACVSGCINPDLCWLFSAIPLI